MSWTGKRRDFSALQLAVELPYTVVQEPEERRMFKIHRSATGEQVIFALSGRMDNEAIAELESEIRSETNGRQIVLDIGDLTLVGPNDIDFLARCEAGGIMLVKCARYIRKWIASNQGGT
jgi:hypothetical protein